MAKKVTKAPDDPMLNDLADAYLASIQKDGRTGKTAASYAGDLKVAMKFLGAETLVRDLTADRVGEFFAAPVVTTKRDGTPKNPISVAKTRRILRLALLWAAERGWVDAAPLPAKTAAVVDDATTGPVSAPVAPPAGTPTDVTDPVPFDHPELARDHEDPDAKRPKRGKKSKVGVAAE